MNQIQSGPGGLAAGTAAAPTHILAPTDLSARSDRALARAAALATEHGAKLTVLHVIDAELPDKARAAAAEAARDTVTAALGGGGAALDIREGEDFRDILAAAEAHGADLLVMGRHRNEDGLKPLGGTTLDRVVRYGRVPVLLAAGPVGGAYRKVVAGLDLSEGSVAALALASKVAPGAELHGVHAYMVPFAGFQSGAAAQEQERAAHAEQIDALLAAMPGGVGVTRHLVHGDAAKVLRDAVVDMAPDLVAMGTHARTGIARAVIGSLAENFLAHPPCDVLVARAGPIA
ncbi:MAG: universal stress protein [Pseudomonadota bacterium]